MKFEKFVKQLGGSGVIQTRENGEKWLASATSMLKIPDQMGGILSLIHIYPGGNANPPGRMRKVRQWGGYRYE